MLINTKTGEYGAYQQEELRFPASVVKTFWLVYFYEKVQRGLLKEANFVTFLNKMIKESDNNSASVIVDAISGTQSGFDLTGEEYENWLNQRKQVNKYFQRAGYENINVNQKTFPITNIKLFEPKGADLKMRGNPEKPIRNKISARQTARILYKIYSNQAVSAEQSQKMANLLTIDSQTRLIKKDEQDRENFNPVRGFFSESLPSDIYFGAKAGWTSFTRNEAAYIETPDRKVAYILVVFGEDKAYAMNWKIFPKMSNIVYKRMTN
jgi:beta-lactamase class A